MIDRKQIGKRLAMERKRLGYSQAEFAKICDVSGASQFIYEKGDRSLTVDYLLKAAKVGLDVDAILMEIKPTQSALSIQDLKRLYVKTDNDCRDINGKLLDLEQRADYFENSVENYPKQIIESEAS